MVYQIKTMAENNILNAKTITDFLEAVDSHLKALGIRFKAAIASFSLPDQHPLSILWRSTTAIRVKTFKKNNDTVTTYEAEGDLNVPPFNFIDQVEDKRDKDGNPIKMKFKAKIIVDIDNSS
jgi:hypothetical protein